MRVLNWRNLSRHTNTAEAQPSVNSRLAGGFLFARRRTDLTRSF